MQRISRSQLLVFAVAGAATSGVASAQTFVNTEIDLGGTGITSFVPDNGPAAAVEWADYDNDGDLDLIVTGIGGDFVPGQSFPFFTRTTVYRNNGDDTFSANISTLPEASSAAAKWLDFDGDGDTDLVLSGYDDAPFTTIFENRGNGQFQNTFADLIDLISGSIDVGDYDNDGDQDILHIGRNGSSFTRIYRNDGDGEFAIVDPDLAQVAAGDAAFVDYDNDGDLDIFLSGLDFAEQAATILYRNDDGQFVDAGAGFPQLFSSAADFGDVDNDGDLDVVLTGVPNEFAEAESYILENLGDGSFQDAGFDGISVFNGEAAFGDHDNDGDLDLLIAGVSSVFSPQELIELYENDGAGQFTPVANTGLPRGIQIFRWGDYDNDGDLDLVAIGDPFTDEDGDGEDDSSNVPDTQIFRNTTISTPAIPGAPDNLTASASSDGLVTFSWDAPSDASGPVTHNLRVGTEPGAGDIVAAMNDPQLGTRLVAASGNVDLNTEWTIEGLPEGSYYWSVQAITSSGQATAFAAEQSVDVVPGAPNADLTGDGLVNTSDVFMLLASWGDAGVVPGADFNGDGVVNAEDLFILLSQWG